MSVPNEETGECLSKSDFLQFMNSFKASIDNIALKVETSLGPLQRQQDELVTGLRNAQDRLTSNES